MFCGDSCQPYSFLPQSPLGYSLSTHSSPNKCWNICIQNETASTPVPEIPTPEWPIAQWLGHFSWEVQEPGIHVSPRDDPTMGLSHPREASSPLESNERKVSSQESPYSSSSWFLFVFCLGALLLLLFLLYSSPWLLPATEYNLCLD